MAPNSPDPTRPRIALYGHDTQGLGHLRRNLHLAAGLAADLPGGLGADVLVLTGASEVGLFERPHGVEAVVVPGVRKDSRGGYSPRRLRGHALDDVVDLRASTITGALRGFNPDILVVDKAPWGFAGELSSVLRELKAQGTTLVLGLRDVLDEPAVAAREWRRDRADEAVRSVYDEVWVYGDAAIHDVPAATGMAPDVRPKVHHVGYVCGRATRRSAPDSAEGRPAVTTHRPPLPAGVREYVLVMLGGGQDGLEVARQAVRMPLPPHVGMVLLTGPQMHSAHVAELMASSAPDHVVMPFSPHASEWLAGACAAITMGGANTVTEILSTDTPALIVPRTRPRREQAVRAEALTARGLVDVLFEQTLTSAALGDWVRTAVTRRVDRSAIDLRGVRGARDRAELLLGRPRAEPVHRQETRAQRVPAAAVARGIVSAAVRAVAGLAAPAPALDPEPAETSTAADRRGHAALSY